MAQRRTLIWLIAALSALSMLTACGGSLADLVGQLNTAGTQAAGGGGGPTPAPVTPEPGVATATLTPLPLPSETPGQTSFDLSIDPNVLLVQAWGQVYALPSGTAFTVRATERQVGDFIIQSLQLAGFDEYVRGGSAVIGSGQIRLDMALVDDSSAFGSGTITFQPTLEAAGRVRINPLGGNFGTLALPGDLYSSFGDEAHAALTGAPTPALSRVALTLIALDSGIMTVSGTVR